MRVRVEKVQSMRVILAGKKERKERKERIAYQLRGRGRRASFGLGGRGVCHRFRPLGGRLWRPRGRCGV